MKEESSILKKSSRRKGSSKKKSQNNDKTVQKVTIDSKKDLYDMPINVMKNTKISNFQGKYYELLYQKALELESNHTLPSEMSNITFSNILNTFPKSHKTINSTNLNNKKTVKRSHKTNNTLKTNNSAKHNIIIDNKNNQKNNKKISNIIFQMRYNTKIGEELFVLGSTLDLGKWNQNRALKLGWNENNVWKAVIPAKDGEDFEFKFILNCNGNLVWESGNNRRFIYKQIMQLIEQCMNSENIKDGIVRLNNINCQSYTFNIKTKELIIISDWNKK